SQNRKRFDDAVAQSLEEFRRAFLGSLENVAGALAIMGTLLNDDETVGLAELLPDFCELRQHQLPEERTDADVSKIIAFPANGAAAGRIVSVLGMIKRLL